MKSPPKPESLGVVGRSARDLRWGVPVLILWLALGLRLLRLGEANLWWDEALAVWATRKSLLGVTLWTAGDVHPPLYFWLLWFWVRLVGEGPFALRTFSALLGVLAVAVVYNLGYWIGRPTGRAPLIGGLAAALTALARFHVWWSQELRMYVLAGLLGMLSLSLCLRWLRAEEQRADGVAGRSPIWLLLLCGLSAIGALYTIFLSAAFVLVENLLVLAVLLRSRAPLRCGILFLKWIAVQLLILLVLAGWLALSWGRMRTWSVSAPMSPSLFMRLYATLLTTGVSVDIGRYTWAGILPLAILALGLACWAWPRQGADGRARRETTGEALSVWALLLTTLLSAALIYLASIPRGLFYTPRIEARYFVPFAPAFWLLLAWSVARIGTRWRIGGRLCGAALVLLWALFLPGHYSDRFPRDELQTLVRTILSQARPGDAVLLDSGGRYPIFSYYYEGAGGPARLSQEMQRPPMLTVSRREEKISPEEVDQALTEIAKAHRRIWLAEVDVQLTDPERLVACWLEARYPKVLAQGYGANTLSLFDPDGQPPHLAPDYKPQHPLDVPAGMGGRLRGWELPLTTIGPQRTAYISLLWEQLPQEAVTLALRNARGQVLLARTLEPQGAGALQRQRFDFPVYAATPSGRYDIVLQPAPATGEVLGSLRIIGTEPPPRSRIVVPVGVRLGEGILLEGYRLRREGHWGLSGARPGERLVLDLHWRAERRPDRDYTVFAHLLGTAHNPRTQGPVWGQHDSQPLEGGWPTTQWLVGETVVDRHLIPIEEGAPAGVYRLEVGMYTWEDGKRLAITALDGQPVGDHVLLETPVEIE